MKVSQVFAAAAVLLLAAQVAQAQILGLPFYPTPTGMGVMAAAEYAHPGTSQTVLAARAGVGFGPFGITGVVGQYKVSGGGSETMYGGTAAMRLFGGGMIPVSLAAQAGVGQIKLAGTTVTTMPVGAALRANVPLFPVKPFVVAYYMLGTNVKKEFRASIGADFNFVMGFGVHAAYDMGSANVWGIGAHFNFRLPVM